MGHNGQRTCPSILELQPNPAPSYVLRGSVSDPEELSFQNSYRKLNWMTRGVVSVSA